MRKLVLTAILLLLCELHPVQTRTYALSFTLSHLQRAEVCVEVRARHAEAQHRPARPHIGGARLAQLLRQQRALAEERPHAQLQNLLVRLLRFGHEHLAILHNVEVVARLALRDDGWR